MMELYQHYFVLFLTDYQDQLTFISNTDPVTYTPDIRSAKLYDNEVNADNDILDNYERMKTLIDNTDMASFYKGYVKKDTNTGNIEFIWREKII